MDKKILLETKGLSYSYSGDDRVLDHIDLKIREGERIVILGPNGAGKSTLFLLLNGVLEPEEGEILLENQKITRKRGDLRKLREKVGIVFQNPDDQIIAPTVREEVSFGPVNLGLRRDQVKERTDEAMEQMEILSFKDRAPHYLSGGEKKRVTVADIIAMDPQIFIFDEPTAALDPKGAESLERTLKFLSDNGKTVIISTHNVDFAWRWADRIIVITKGEIIAEGRPLEIFMDRKILKKAHLKCPVLIDVIRILREHHLLPKDTVYPRDIHGFERLIESLDNCMKNKSY